MSALAAASSSFLSSDSLTSQSPPKPSSPTIISPPYSINHNFPRAYRKMTSVDLRGQHIFPTSQPVSLDTNPGMTFAESLKTWTDAHVARWLFDMKCGMHAETFRANDIRGDVLLELDQDSLKEMSITSIGDRIRILNAVKLLRLRAASNKSASPVRTTRLPEPTRSVPESLRPDPNSGIGRGHARKESARPPPLTLHPIANKGDLPDLIREPPDSAGRAPAAPPVRPLPVPSNLPNSTPSSTQSQSSTPGGSSRPNLPPLPPPPRSQPPPLPPTSNRSRFNVISEAPAYTSQPLPPPPLQPQGLLTPSNGTTWDSRNKPARSTSPLPPPRVRGPVAKASGAGVTSPNSSPARRNNHPYASVQATLHPPTNLQNHNLSPIEEAFQHSSATSTPSPPSQTYNGSRLPFNASTSYTTPSLDDIRKKIVKFIIPEEGTSFTIDVTNCYKGQEVIEKVLKKVGKGGFRSVETDGAGERGDDNTLSVDGWAVYNDSLDDLPSEPLSEVQLLNICNAPDHPARERGLTVRRLRRAEDRGGSPLSRNPAPAGQTSRATKRASSISVLSGLGVRNPEKALVDPPSPSADTLSPSSGIWPGGKRPSKLRNFFGQRPPSELITDHLPEFFPMAEKKVLRTARHSILLRSGTISKRHSTTAAINQAAGSSFSPGRSRRSISPSQASFSSLPPPPLPDKYEPQGDPIPRMSLSTESGHSIDLHSDDDDVPLSASLPPPQLLPPIPVETASFSESMEEITGNNSRPSRPVSRATSIASKRLSFMSELRSKRDRSDTASMLTVDEITAEVESRRVSQVPEITNADLEGWTKVDNTDTFDNEPAVPADEIEEDDVTTLATEDDEEAGVDDEDVDDDDEDSDEDDFGIAIPTRTANKWIKGALIGAGSFGKVYLGMDASNGLLMAVKQVELPVGDGPSQERKKSMLSALEREIELLKVLQHDNIVQYLYSSLDDEFLNIFLEYVPGGSVATLLGNYGAFEERLVRNFVRQILQGLDYLHERDIIHRDIKGANILVDNKGGVKISDFGISKKVDDNLLGGNRLHRPSLQGSVFWMAPEVVKQTGHTKKADIWSVGCLVVEMLTGEHPWAQLTQMQAIFKIGSSARPTIPADISPEAQDFLHKTFEINHELRPHATELLQHPWLSKKAKKAANAAAAAAAAAASANASPNEA